MVIKDKIVKRDLYCQRLENYFAEAKRHIEHIQMAKAEIGFPVGTYSELPNLEKFALNTIVFRFSKLQDLIGAKIFRSYLEFAGLSTEGFGFFDILKEIEKEGIVDIDSWIELRDIRNDIAHDYPDDFDDMIDRLNLLIEKSDLLISVENSIRIKYNEINK